MSEESRPMLSDLLAKYARPGSEEREEHRRYLRLEAAKRQRVEERLRAVDAFHGAREAGTADVGRLADRLGMTARNLYRLARRVAAEGAVDALAPRLRRSGDRSIGLADRTIELLRKEVSADPLLPLAELVGRVIDADPTAPPTTVRRHALAMKSEAREENWLLGRSLLIDQAAVRMPVAGPDGLRWLRCAFLADRTTGYVLGRSVIREDGELGVDAILDCVGRAGELLGRFEAFAPTVEIVWVTPFGSRERSELVAGRAGEFGLRLALSAHGRFRQGRELVNLLGGSLATWPLMVRATVDPRATLRCGDPEPMTEAAAVAILDAAIARVNDRWPKDELQELRTRCERASTLRDSLGRTLGLFAPLLPPDGLARARDDLEGLG